jgi:hypothetical protein
MAADENFARLGKDPKVRAPQVPTGLCGDVDWQKTRRMRKVRLVLQAHVHLPLSPEIWRGHFLRETRFQTG